jgi:hypothetical protein
LSVVFRLHSDRRCIDLDVVIIIIIISSSSSTTTITVTVTVTITIAIAIADPDPAHVVETLSNLGFPSVRPTAPSDVTSGAYNRWGRQGPR